MKMMKDSSLHLPISTNQQYFFNHRSRSFLLLLLLVNSLVAWVTKTAIVSLYYSSLHLQDQKNAIKHRNRNLQECCGCPQNWNCPLSGSLSIGSGGGFVKLAVSNDKLCTLTIAMADGFIRPVARSYSGFWEASSGDFASLQFSCHGDGFCLVKLDDIATERSLVQYQLTSYDTPNYTPDDVASRFLEQATFGPTRTDINTLLSSGTNLQLAFANWVQDQQQNVPISSHREFFRKHANSQFEFASPIGTVTHPCYAGTRYRKFALSSKDDEKTVTIAAASGGRKSLAVDGQIRTMVDGPVTGTRGGTFPDGSYLICRLPPQNLIGGAVYLQHPTVGCTQVQFSPTLAGNPPVSFPAGSFSGSSVTLLRNEVTSIDQEYYNNPDLQALILNKDLSDPTCASIDHLVYPATHTFGIINGEYWIHDPRFNLTENTVTNPIPDGGGRVVQETQSALLPEANPLCANVRRNFLNQDHCILSSSPDTCLPGYNNNPNDGGDDETLLIPVTHDFMRAIYQVSDETVYLYAIDSLRIEDDPLTAPPCQKGSTSRWILLDQPSCSNSLRARTEKIFSRLISFYENTNENTNVLDVTYPNNLNQVCNGADELRKGFDVADLQGNCWRNVHPDYLNVYDFTVWTTNAHPGNSPARNPIKEFAEAGSTFLEYPSWHEMDRWQDNKRRFTRIGRLGDMINYYDIPLQLRTPELDQALGLSSSTSVISNTNNSPQSDSDDDVLLRLVCGSSQEISNNATLSGIQGRGAFDIAMRDLTTTSQKAFHQQKKQIWTELAMKSPDQLRQRVAWALAQLLVVSTGDISRGQELTEVFTVYYDIFVRNAFGNYLSVLKEVSYSPLMAEMLTYYGSQSTAYVYERKGNVEYADENYAREIMQLFTTGLYMLDEQGMQALDEDDHPIRVYDNDDIEEYARAWTGFQHQPARGNIESYTLRDNRIDPMNINQEYRDRFPKMGLDRRYIGDGVPLCADLPDQHFLKVGAIYRLLGTSPTPELQVDPVEWRTSSAYKPLTLAPNADGLFFKLCGSSNPDACDFQPTVVLEESITCHDVECSVDTIRTVQVAKGMFYEYVRPPCVHQAFFENPKTVARRYNRKEYVIADANTASAGTACCDEDLGTWNEKYWGERTTYSTAQSRCASDGQSDLCSSQSRPVCRFQGMMVNESCYSNHYFWTNIPCTLRAKIHSSGKIAVVHEISLDEDVAKHVQEDSPTLFRVDWAGDYTAITSNCGSYAHCNAASDGSCICDVSISHDQVYMEDDIIAGNLTADNILERLTIGAFDPSMIGSSVSGSKEEVSWFSDSEGFSSSTVFQFIDSNGISQLRKNVISKVTIRGTDVSFRNPVHFVSLVDPEPRDAHHETDETLNHYFYHENTAPFLAKRFSQRFGISNPSPRYIQTISTSFRTGSYTVDTGDGTVISYGSNEYGDLAATFASILLDGEARDIVLDSDPAQGSLKEPLLKLIGLMRSLEYQQYESEGFINFSSDITDAIGQMAHEIPNVFSFFLPDYQPAGVITKGSLVSPEAQVISGPSIIGTLNGFYSLIKYGLGSCFGGLGDNRRSNCRQLNMQQNAGNLTFIPSSRTPAEVVDELATLLTAGRLSANSRQVVQRLFSRGVNPYSAYLSAQQIIASTPEFHSTNLIRFSGESRPDPPAPPPPDNPYKALVYVLLSGGVDSYNLIVPHTCSEKNPSGQTPREQYTHLRTSIAINDDERSRIIPATRQPCSEFVVHEALPTVESLYKAGDLAFFANMGVLNAPVSKENYRSVTETQLFAHNTMQLEAQKIDPYSGAPGTGVLGRMVDVLLSKGYAAKPITVDSSSVATVGVPGNGTDPLFVSSRGAFEFNPGKRGEFEIGSFITEVNEATEKSSGLFGETWSSRLQLALKDNEELVDVLSDSVLTQPFDGGSYSYARRLGTVASLIVSHERRGTDRDIFFVDFGGWDHHNNMKIELSDHFQSLDIALSDFTLEMQEQDLWNNVTLVITSDFARTLTANSGEGSDHAWAGNYFITGGSVSGGQIHGRYPSDITEDGPYNIGRGRLIPDLSWESMLNSVAMHMGIETENELSFCMPNRVNAGARLFTEAEVFDV